MPQPRKFNDTEKWCNGCKKWLLHARFKKDSGTVSGLMSWCKECDNARIKARWTGIYRQKGNIQSRKYGRSTSGRFLIHGHSARKRGIECSLSLIEYTALIACGKCHYCGGPLPETGGALDRKESSKGYTKENCVPCCLACNLIRGNDNISYEEMLEVSALLRRLRHPRPYLPIYASRFWTGGASCREAQ